MEYVRLWQNVGGWHNALVFKGRKYMTALFHGDMRIKRYTFKKYEALSPKQPVGGIPTMSELKTRIAERLDLYERCGAHCPKKSIQRLLARM